jgi:hypothetical protein
MPRSTGGSGIRFRPIQVIQRCRAARRLGTTGELGGVSRSIRSTTGRLTAVRARVGGDTEPPVAFAAGDRHIVAVLATVAAALFAFASRLRLNEQPWGDEPHYLIMSIALGKYHTFDLTEAYANGDYRSFHPQKIDAHVFPAADGTVVPLHNFGGPLLWTLPFTWWGRAGAAAVIVLISVLVVVNLYHLLRELGIVKAYAGLVTGLFVIGTPLYTYASMQFIEPIGALLVIFAVRAVLRPTPSRTRIAIASAGLGYLPWVHGRLILFSAVLGGLLVARVDRASLRAYLPAVAPMALLILGLELFNLTRYGSLSPAPGNANLGDGLFQIGPLTGLSRLAFDRQYGLLSHFPVLVLAVPGLLLAVRRGALRRHVVLLAVIVPYVLAVSTFRSWWAGYSPPGRLLAVVTPLLAYYVAVALQRLHSWTVTTLATLAALAAFAYSVTGDIFTVARFTTSGGAGVDPVLNYLAEVLHLNGLPDLLPTGIGAGPNRVGFWAWFLVLAGFSGLVWLLGRYRPVDRIPAPAMVDLFPLFAGRSVEQPGEHDHAPGGRDEGLGPESFERLLEAGDVGGAEVDERVGLAGHREQAYDRGVPFRRGQQLGRTGPAGAEQLDERLGGPADRHRVDDGRESPDDLAGA